MPTEQFLFSECSFLREFPPSSTVGLLHFEMYVNFLTPCPVPIWAVRYTYVPCTAGDVYDVADSGLRSVPPPPTLPRFRHYTAFRIRDHAASRARPSDPYGRRTYFSRHPNRVLLYPTRVHLGLTAGTVKVVFRRSSVDGPRSDAAFRAGASAHVIVKPSVGGSSARRR